MSTTEHRSAPQAAQRDHRDVIRAFQAVADALRETRDVDALLSLIADQVCLLLDATRCSIHLYDKVSGLYHGRVANTRLGIDERVRRLVLGMPADGFSREIIETRSPVVLTNAMDDPRAVRSAMRRFNTHAVLGVPLLLRDDVIGLLIVDNEAERHDFSPEALELAMAFAGLAASAIDQAQLNTRLRTTLGTVARQNKLLRRASALEDQLSALLVDGSGLQDTADLVTKTTGRLCAVYAADMRRVVRADVERSADRLPLQLLDLRDPKHERAVAAVLAVADGSADVVGPFAELGVHHRYMVAPIRLRDAAWGFFVLAEHASRFNALDAAIARRAATNVAVELSVEHRAVGERWEAYEALAATLVRGTHADDWVTKRAGLLGVPLHVDHVVCLVAAARDGVAPPPAATLSDMIDAAGGGQTLGTSIEGNAVLVLEDRTQGGRDPADLLVDVLEQTDAPEALIGLVSRSHPGVRGIKAGYDEALQLLDVARAHVAPSGGAVLTAGEVGVGRLLLGSISSGEAARFAADTLGPLALGATAKSRELLLTLDAFLKTHSVGQTAKELAVHENTVRYRLGRVAELTRLAVLSDPDDQMSAALAILVVKAQGVLPELGTIGRRIGALATAVSAGGDGEGLLPPGPLQTMA